MNDRTYVEADIRAAGTFAEVGVHSSLGVADRASLMMGQIICFEHETVYLLLNGLIFDEPWARIRWDSQRLKCTRRCRV